MHGSIAVRLHGLDATTLRSFVESVDTTVFIAVTRATDVAWYQHFVCLLFSRRIRTVSIAHFGFCAFWVILDDC